MACPRAARTIVVSIALLLSARPAAAQGVAEGLRAIVDSTVSVISTTTTDVNGVVTTTEGTNWYPRLTLNADTLITPTFRLSAGGMFELSTSDTTSQFGAGADRVDVSATLLRLRPFIEVRSTNQAFSPGAGYYRRENRTSSRGTPTRTLVSDDYAAYLGVKPTGLPHSDLQFVRTRTFDADRTTDDTTKDFGSILSRYNFKGTNLYYQGSFLDTTDRLRGFQTRQVANSARMAQSRSFFKRRLQWNAAYSIDRQTLTAKATGDGGEVAVPVAPFAGMSALSDTPLTIALTQNGGLIDGNLTASAGINIGVPAVGAESQARNIGLDFVTPTEVNRLWLWVDRDLLVNIANAFTWELYTSTDNITWRRETLVSAAPFGPFDFRFQIDFASVTARYLKVVTRPLSGAVLDAGRFPDILITELQAFRTQRAGEGGDTLVRTGQNLNTDVRLRLLDTPTLYYEGSYWLTDAPSGYDRRTLSNGLAVNQRLGRMVSASARAAYEQGTQSGGPRTATVTNAILTVDPVPTLTTSLLYTGLNEKLDGKPNDRNGVSLQTNAQLYRGVSVQCGVGLNYSTRTTGESLRDRFFNVSGSVVPRNELTLTFSYADMRSERSGTFVGNPTLRTRTGYATLTIDPIPTLHVVLAEELVAIEGERTRNTHNIGINWAPFPDGSLQFILAYNEAVRPLEFGSERIFRPGVRWVFSRQSYIDVSYQRVDNDQFVQRTRTKIFSIDLKLFL